MSFIPSTYQQAFFDWVQTGTGSALVNAVAGSGKTTTIVQSLSLISDDQDVLFLAFNKKIATELQARVPKHVMAATFHSRGYAAWRRHTGGSVSAPDGNKSRELVRRYFSQFEAEAFGGTICKWVSVAKSAGIGAIMDDNEDNWFALAAHYDIELPEGDESRRRIVEAARRLLSLSVAAAMERSSRIDFDDMLYMPLLKDAPFDKVDWLFVDESQDTNAVQLAILRRMLKPGGRLVAVGDPRQAIYGFRGADAAAMNNIRAAFNCCELPLTISYRCAQSVVRLAQSIVPHMQASATAPEGEVLTLDMDKVTFKNTDVIICRNTAPIVELAYQLIGKGVGCKVLGREIGAALATLINKLEGANLDDMLTKLDTFTERESAKFLSKGQEQKAEAVKDRAECIRAIATNLPESSRTTSALLSAIDRMFSDDSGTGLLTLCTAHKSKGLEWDRVFIYRADLMPSKYARQAWQQEQEKNLQYVAWTRAKRTLVFIARTAAQLAATTAPVSPAVPVIAALPGERMRQYLLRMHNQRTITLSQKALEFWATD